MSVDPLGGNISDPQTLNRYAYVRNNPLTLTDPSGMDPCDDPSNAACGGPYDGFFGCGGIGICLFDCDSGPTGPQPVYSPPPPSTNLGDLVNFGGTRPNTLR